MVSFLHAHGMPAPDSKKSTPVPTDAMQTLAYVLMYKNFTTLTWNFVTLSLNVELLTLNYDAVICVDK